MTKDERLYGAIVKQIRKRPGDTQAYCDAFSCLLNMAEKDVRKSGELKGLIRDGMRAADGRVLYDLNKKILCYEAPVLFDSFMLYIESDRPMGEQFWLPRRKKLKMICEALQEMEDGGLKELFLTLPPRIGKTTIVLFFLLWVMGKHTENSNLYVSYSDPVASVMFDGLIEVLGDQVTYKFYDVFPAAKIANTNAKESKLNLERKKRYASFTARSLYGSLNGMCDCNGYLVADDLLSGIEEAVSKERLSTAWVSVNNNMIPRAKESAKIIWIGTRWSISDPIGVRLDMLENDPAYKDRKWKIITLPALDEKDESNFMYDFGVGFSTQYYRERRASFEKTGDLASWLAQYQGQPIEREGAVFSPDDLRYYNGVLPEVEPDRVFMCVDPAWGGGDYVSAPVVYQYGEDLFVQDVVFNNGDKMVTQPIVIDKIKSYNVRAVRIEGTKMTSGYSEDISKRLKDEHIRINLQSVNPTFTGRGKRQRIFDRSPEIRERCVFLEPGKRSKEYTAFMTNLFSFTITGKEAKHDDAPDSLAMVCEMAERATNKVEIFNRPY